MCLVDNVRKLIKEVIDGTVSLSRNYGKLIEEAMLGSREGRLALARAKL